MKLSLVKRIRIMKEEKRIKALKKAQERSKIKINLDQSEANKAVYG